jgi:hypothetical protein
VARNEPRRVPRPPREGEGDTPAAGRRKARQGNAAGLGGQSGPRSGLLLIQSNNERTKGKRRRARPRAQSGKEGEARAGCACHWLLIQSKKTEGKEGKQ